MLEISCVSPALALHQGSMQGSGGLRMPRFGVLIPLFLSFPFLCGFFFPSLRSINNNSNRYDDDLRDYEH